MELQSLPTVPAGNVAGMIVSLLVAFGLPIGLYLYLKHKKYARTSSFVTGMLVFILFAMVLETAVHSLVFSLAGPHRQPVPVCGVCRPDGRRF